MKPDDYNSRLLPCPFYGRTGRKWVFHPDDYPRRIHADCYTRTFSAIAWMNRVLYGINSFLANR